MVKNKKAAIELSMSTIVILVLAMTMLILGIVLVNKIFGGATNNVDTMNQKVKDQISKLFAEDTKLVINLPNGIAKMTPGEDFGISFGVRNKASTQEFKWTVKINDEDIKAKCGISKEDTIMKWITGGRTGKTDIVSGDQYEDIIRFNVPEGAINDISKCVIRFKLVVEQEDGSAYATAPFDVSFVK